MDRNLIIKGQTNQRLDFNSLDSRRRSEEKEAFLEFSLKASFFEPYFLGTSELEGVVVASRKDRGF